MQSKSTGTYSVGNIFKVSAIRNGNREAVFCSMTGRRFSFIELNERVNRLANGLQQQGLKKGDTAGFLCMNRAEIFEIFGALAKIGVIGIPLNYRLSSDEIIELMDHCEANTFIFDPTFQDIASKVHEKLPKVIHYVGIEAELPFATSYESLLKNSSPDEPEVEICEEDIQYFNLTSGTTGHPKMYALTHYNNVTALILMGMIHDLTSDDVVLTAFPIFGRVGFGWCLASLIVGCRNVIHQFELDEVVPLIESEKVTISNLVPTMASFILSLNTLDKHDLSSLRALVFAASPLSMELQTEIKKRLCPRIYEYYGLQESAILVNSPPEDKDRKPSSVGRPVFGAEVRIVDPDGNDVEAGEIGEIIARAPSATSGYYKNPEKTAACFKNGWFHTEDLGKFDDEGFLYLSGRAKDMIITGGQNVFAVEVEDTIMTHPAVAECAVIGLPDKIWGEAVSAVVIKKPDSDVSEEELIGYVKGKIAGFKTPKRIFFSDKALPRTPTGKVTKFVLVEEYSG